MIYSSQMPRDLLYVSSGPPITQTLQTVSTRLTEMKMLRYCYWISESQIIEFLFNLSKINPPFTAPLYLLHKSRLLT